MHIRKLAAITSLALGVSLLTPSGLLAQEDTSAETYRQLQLFGKVLERIRKDYVEEVSDKELIEAAIQGMLTDLDPHSSYLNADNFKDMRVQTKGEFGGLGIEVSMENGFVKVVSPIDDTPAFHAGVEAGDLITHLDGEPVLGLTLSDAVDLMRGPVDSTLTITVRRGELEPFDIDITRDIIKVQSVRSRVEGEVGYIRITSFNEQTTPGLVKAMRKISEELGDDLDGFVLDLRNNPGGLLDEAISVSDTFLDRGEIVSTRGRVAEDSQRWNATEGDLSDGLPLVVLINGGSASASEIVAGALQDHRRAIIMGTRSFGKGSVQTIMPLDSHGAMRLTTARYYTPSGNSIQAKGIEPDILVDRANVETLEMGPRRREADLRGRLENDTQHGGQLPAGGQEEETEEVEVDLAVRDYQLARAIDLLRGLALFQDTASK
ncbi:S41 family peptidase [Rhodovibrionaceae bacterium A322]